VTVPHSATVAAVVPCYRRRGSSSPSCRRCGSAAAVADLLLSLICRRCGPSCSRGSAVAAPSSVRGPLPPRHPLRGSRPCRRLPCAALDLAWTAAAPSSVRGLRPCRVASHHLRPGAPSSLCPCRAVFSAHGPCRRAPSARGLSRLLSVAVARFLACGAAAPRCSALSVHNTGCPGQIYWFAATYCRLWSCCASLFCAVSAQHRVSRSDLLVCCAVLPSAELLRPVVLRYQRVAQGVSVRFAGLPCRTVVCFCVARSIVHSLLPLGILVPSNRSASDLLIFTVFLLCNMSANAIVVNIMLDGQNYSEWAFCVHTVLRGHGLLFHFNEDSPVLAADRSNAAAIKTWQINVGKVMAAMVNITKPTMIMSLSKFTTAQAIWSHLKDLFVQDSGALLHTLMQQTHAIKQHDMFIDEYYSAFDRLMSALTSMVPACTVVPCPAHKFIEKFFTYRFVMGVRSKFDSLRARLLHS
jgi:hypothetical protein